jgi:hypothetical protein
LLVQGYKASSVYFRGVARICTSSDFLVAGKYEFSTRQGLEQASC